MRNNSQDDTIKRNYIQKYRFLIREYELVKEKKHPRYRYAQEFYEAHDTDRRAFRKYYNRFKNSGNEEDLLPRKRGPKWKTRRAPDLVEAKVKELREKGMNRYEIVNVLSPELKELTPSPSGVYTILKRHALNRLKPPMMEEKRRIIKEKAGELAHIDCHHLSKSLVLADNKHRYLVCVIDSCTRVAWAEVVDDIKALTVMFTTLRCFNVLSSRYSIQFSEVLTDNGPEVGTKESKQKEGHPFERMLMELGIKHRYTKPYRPQTNGKVERFWRTLEEDLIYETTFDSIDEFKDELMQYLIYYNEHRPHSALGGKTPAEFNQICPRNT
jgi:transposase InsO family protein